MHFGENQLSRSLIGLSPLPTAHPLHFQLKWVRSSTTSYRRFNLAMGRSLRFGSRSRHCNALFRLAFATASPHGLTSRRNTNSQAHSSKGTPSREQSPLRRLVGTRFQVLFHSPPGVLFTFPSRYLSAIGHQEVFRLTGWSRQIHSELHGLAATRARHNTDMQCFRLRGSHPLRRRVPTPSTNTTHPRTTSTAAVRDAPQHPTGNPCQVSHRRGLASSAFARHYSRNHGCFLFLRVLRCFTSPRSLHPPYTFRRG